MRSILTFFAVLASAQLAFAHASHKMHEADIFAVFNGCDDPEFKRIAKRISSGMDNELPRRFRAEIGVVPGNHRLLGHCWTFGDAIPRRVLNVVEQRHPGRRGDFIRLWQTFANEIIDDVSQATGLPRKQAGALAALIHDVHLLGDRTPDNRLVDYVLTTDEIRRNIVKCAGRLWGKQSEVVSRIENAIRVASSQSVEESERAEKMLLALKEQGIGNSVCSLLSTIRLRTIALKRGCCYL